MKKKLLSIAILATLSSLPTISSAEDTPFIFQVPIKSPLSSWSTAAPFYHPWVDTGSHYGCNVWSPNVNTINFGTSFNQSRDCNQDQERDVEIKEKDAFSGIIKTVSTVQEYQTITEIENQNAIGILRNWVSHSSTYSDWADFGVDHTHTAWSPTANSQTIGFTQSRDFKHDQERFEQQREIDTVTTDIRDTGAPIRHTKNVDRDESRPVTVQVTAWSDVGVHYGCAAWSPLPSTVDVYEAFTQSRDCDQNQTRRWSYDASGSEIHARMQNQTIAETETQDSTGTKRQWGPTTSTFTAWVDNGAHHTFGNWTPVPSTETANYTQTRSVKQPQKRVEQPRELDSISGEIRNLGSTITHNQNINESESRVVSVSWSVWTDTTKDTYSAWSPLPSAQTASYTQSRTYSQNQTRNRTYKAEGSTIKTSAEVRTLSSQVENRSVTVSVGSWSNTTRSGYGSWSPSASTQTSTFTQTRSYTQNQARTWTYSASGSQIHSRVQTQGLAGQSEARNVTVSWSGWSFSLDHSHGSWSPTRTTTCSNSNLTQTRSYQERQARTRSYSSGDSATEYQDISRTESRNVSGTKTCENWISASSSYSSWTNTGGPYGCGGWSPSTSSYNLGSSFTQSRSCSQDQRQTEYYRQRDTISGAYRTTGSTYNYRTLSDSDSRSATGTKDYITGTSVGSWGGWSDYGGLYSCSSWSPSPSTVNLGTSFTQSSTCRQAREHFRPTYNNWASGSQTTKSTERGTGYTNVGKTQGATGTKDYVTRTFWGSWWNTGGIHSCGTYSPSTSTVSSGTTFTQTASCKQRQGKTEWQEWKSGKTDAKRNIYQDINATGTRNATGTKVASYSWVGLGGRPSTVDQGNEPSSVSVGSSCSSPGATGGYNFNSYMESECDDQGWCTQEYLTDYNVAVCQ